MLNLSPVSFLIVGLFQCQWIVIICDLLKCMGKLRRDREEDVILAKRHCQHQGKVQKSTLVPLAKLLSHVQVSQLRNSWPHLSSQFVYWTCDMFQVVFIVFSGSEERAEGCFRCIRGLCHRAGEPEQTADGVDGHNRKSCPGRPRWWHPE